MLYSFLVKISYQQLVYDHLSYQNATGYNKQPWDAHSVSQADHDQRQERCVPSLKWELRVQMSVGFVALSFAATAAPLYRNFDQNTDVRHQVGQDHTCLDHT